MAWRLLLGVVAFAVAAPAAVATADPAPMSRLNWILDGAVQAAVRLGDTLYVGGTFTSVAPPANALPPVYALSPTSGAVVPGVLPVFSGTVSAIEPDGAGGMFVGGSGFRAAGGDYTYLTHVLADGSVDPAFTSAVDGSVKSMARVGTTLFLHGDFAAIDGARVGGLGAVSTTTGRRVNWTTALPADALEQWVVAADGRVVVGARLPSATAAGNYALTVHAFDAASGATVWASQVFAGTSTPAYGAVFGPVAVSSSRVLAAVATTNSPRVGAIVSLDPATGAIDPAWTVPVVAAAMTVVGSSLYIGGDFTTVSGLARQNLAAVSLATGAVLPWNPGAFGGGVRFLAPSGTGGVFVAGDFTYVSSSQRHRLAEIDGTGSVTAWQPAVRPDVVTLLAPSGAGTLVVQSNLVATGGAPRNGSAAFNLVTGALLPWAPDTGPVRFLAASGSRVYVSRESAGEVFVDATTGAMTEYGGLWSVFADDSWLYRWFYNGPTNAPSFGRWNLISGEFDTSWPATRQFLPDRMAVSGDRLYLVTGGGTVAALDRRTGRVLWQGPVSSDARDIAISGDTVYVAGGNRLQMLDARTGEVIAARFLAFPVGAMAVADGRLVLATGPGPGFRFTPPWEAGLALTDFTGAVRPWPAHNVIRRLAPGPRETIVVAGDVLVAGGLFGTSAAPALQGLAVFDLGGAKAPFNFRARPRGADTELTWDAPVQPPPGGYAIEAGVVPGGPQVTVPVGVDTAYTVTVPRGNYLARVRAIGTAGGDEFSNEIRVTGTCASAPAAPARLTASVSGGVVDLQWTPPDALVLRYTLEAGSASGRSDLAQVSVAPSSTRFVASGVPAGTYFARVRATNDCGTSGPSGEVFVTVGAAETLPGAPAALHVLDGVPRLLQWTPPAGAVTGYVLEAGTDVGQGDLGALRLGPAPSFVLPPLPRGTYLVRVRAVNGAGTGPPSNELVLVVP